MTIANHKAVLIRIFFMTHWAIPMIAYPRVRCMFIYIYIIINFVSLTRVCIACVVKEVASFRRGGLSRLMGVAHNNQETI